MWTHIKISPAFWRGFLVERGTGAAGSLLPIAFTEVGQQSLASSSFLLLSDPFS